MIGYRVAAGVLVLAFGSVTLVAACSSDSSTPSGGTTSPPTSGRISAASGGTVSDPSGNTTLTIPPGALAQDTDITLAILPKSGSAAVEVSEFGPNGLTFLKPATLAIKADPALATGGKSLGLAVEESGAFNALPGASYANGVGTGPIMHFSKYTIALFGGAPVDAGTDSGGSDCQPTGGLTPPAAGETIINATFSEPVGYNGNSDPFMGIATPGTVINPGQASRFASRNKAMATFGDKTGQTISLTLEPTLVACKSYTTVRTPVPGYPALRLTDDAGSQWWCGGTITVDTVNGMAVTFHFDTVCAAGATSTVRLVGKGAGTLNVN